ncbi:isopropylmalate/homocitrate/citramalate synthase-like protein [Moorella thermoacetica]|uniref:Isopropylmalate/homocitrate/citramalate synthases-like protein n=1 Tax=Moorella thermoacetica (strain ATCC 39073 / JCM 9320) TaxID=264732 RepID=Q2RL07_MOOTA|nr:isopropylmalate/homocitrate/citramalate synthase-like protein [Moorella thermoacetica]AKX93305.1 2-isopropylmalate synthase [Moorella thermoacetica]AKX95948.1 2-isopropylmalate synthase [Moorella thermoacetica]OIQ56033.1 2-isopropylmalate synthase [Moorella thermoacetica]OIQ61068.1 2-isopropylmalate synthase [Moorella thermoacetica]QCZ99758.1 2-isopropylmalate synthase [Moorella thermoacetica]
MQLKEIPITGIPYDQLYIEKLPATPEYCRRPAELLPAGNRSVVVNPNRTCMPLGAMWGAHLSRLKEKVDLELEFHGHNDFGLATANALAAVRAGVRWIDTTVGGLGERAGNTSLEELYRVLTRLFDLDPGLNSRYLPGLERYVTRAAGRLPPAPVDNVPEGPTFPRPPAPRGPRVATGNLALFN